MRDHGVDMPDPKVSADGGISIGINGGRGKGATTERAQRACQHFLEDAAPKGGKRSDPAEEARMRRQALAFAKCMREHGLDFPDPTFSSGGRVSQRLKGDPNSPRFRAAQKDCAKATGMPAPGKGGGFAVRGGGA
jgi:hypothetical protein